MGPIIDSADAALEQGKAKYLPTFIPNSLRILIHVTIERERLWRTRPAKRPLLPGYDRGWDAHVNPPHPGATEAMWLHPHLDMPGYYNAVYPKWPAHSVPFEYHLYACEATIVRVWSKYYRSDTVIKSRIGPFVREVLQNSTDDWFVGRGTMLRFGQFHAGELRRRLDDILIRDGNMYSLDMSCNSLILARQLLWAFTNDDDGWVELPHKEKIAAARTRKGFGRQ